MLLVSINGVPVTDAAPGVLTYTSGLAVDADGDPRAYHPNGRSGLDHLANARANPRDPSSRWVGVVTDESGQPYVQGPSDLAPGFLVSPTSLADPTRRREDPARYVPAGSFPYIAVPGSLRKLKDGFTVGLGDFAMVERIGGAWSPAIVADIGPGGRIGEGSIALARALGLPASARNGGTDKLVIKYTVWAGSAQKPAWPVRLEDLTARVGQLRAALASGGR